MGNAQRESRQPKIRVYGFSEQDQTALYMQVRRARLQLGTHCWSLLCALWCGWPGAAGSLRLLTCCVAGVERVHLLACGPL